MSLTLRATPWNNSAWSGVSALTLNRPGDKHLGDEGSQVRLAPGLLLCAKGGAPVLRLRAGMVGHR